MSEPLYREPQPLSREEAEQLLDGDDPAVVNPALFGLLFGGADPAWLQEQCIRLSEHRVWNVRAAASTMFGHLAYFHRQLDRERVLPIMRRLLQDVPDVAASARVAMWDILQVFPDLQAEFPEL